MSLMARGIALVMAAAASVACTSCVPASEAAPPAGAFGFVTMPSPASRGEPFATDDGWTIRIEKLALQVNVTATPTYDGSQRRFYGSSGTYRFDASKTVEVFVRALPTGVATGTILLTGSYLGSPGFESSSHDEEQTEVLGLPAEVSARFRIEADAGASIGNTPSYSGPSILLVLRAEKASRVITIDLTLDVYSGSTESQVTGEVRADTLVTVPIGIEAEALFEDDKTRAVRFDDFAAADADNDGRVSGKELREARSCRTCDDLGHPDNRRFFEEVRGRGVNIFRPVPAPR